MQSSVLAVLARFHGIHKLRGNCGLKEKHYINAVQKNMSKTINEPVFQANPQRYIRSSLQNSENLSGLTMYFFFPLYILNSQLYDSQGQRGSDFTVLLECVLCFWGNREIITAVRALGAAGDAR